MVIQREKENELHLYSLSASHLDGNLSGIDYNYTQDYVRKIIENCDYKGHFDISIVDSYGDWSGESEERRLMYIRSVNYYNPNELRSLYDFTGLRGKLSSKEIIEMGNLRRFSFKEFVEIGKPEIIVEKAGLTYSPKTIVSKPIN